MSKKPSGLPSPQEARKAVQERDSRLSREDQRKRREEALLEKAKQERINLQAQKLLHVARSKCGDIIRKTMSDGRRTLEYKLGDCCWFREPPTEPNLVKQVTKTNILNRLYTLLENELALLSEDEGHSYTIERVEKTLKEDNRIFSMNHPSMDKLLWRRFELKMKISF